MLLAGSEGRTTLAFARSLARNDIPFVFASSTPRKGPVSRSRFVEQHRFTPSPTAERRAYAEFFARLAEDSGARLVVPMHDDAVYVLSAHREVVKRTGAVVACGPVSGALNLLDKRAHLALAARLGVPCPAQFDLQSLEQIPELIRAIGFPMVLKNARRGTAEGPAFKWLVANDEQELRSQLALHCADGTYPLFQELVRGTTIGLHCFAVRGEVVALHATHVKRRADGENVFRVVAALDPELARFVQAIVRELEWDGIASLAFFVTPEGQSKYMEMNGRPFGGLEGTIRAGWDMPLWTVRYFLDGARPDPPPIAIGSATCWRGGDVRRLGHILGGRDWLADYPGISKSRAVLDYLSGFRPGVHSDLFRLDDPLPELSEHIDLLRSSLSRVRRRLWVGSGSHR